MKHSIGKSVGWALIHTSRLHRTRIGERLTELGLFPGQEQVLQALAESESLTMGDLADLLRVRPPTASKTIARLASQGLVARQLTKDDARIVRVRLTDEGAKRAAAITQLWDELEEQLLTGLDGKERKRLRKLLRKAARNLGATDEGPADIVEELDNVA
jgi:DNA-binding MarR family transcriptional regulator